MTHFPDVPHVCKRCRWRCSWEPRQSKLRERVKDLDERYRWFDCCPHCTTRLRAER